MPEILPDLVEACDVEQVPHIDEMFNPERDKARCLHASCVRNAVMASDADHETVIFWCKVVAFAAFDVGDDILRDGFRGEVCSLDDLREWLAFENEAGNISHDVHEGIFRGLELHVAVDAIALACG